MAAGDNFILFEQSFGYGRYGFIGIDNSNKKYEKSSCIIITHGVNRIRIKMNSIFGPWMIMHVEKMRMLSYMNVEMQLGKGIRKRPQI
ncbi:hypothetical protein PAAL66ix_06368 [Paenibacillus alvei A6-6i-x]|nr:hypothetical protein PAAL66ix_06368 [Paenibacillus alvei A6-6i-x]